ncbi:MAG: hypothetical protein M1348_00700 [Candidatus Parvarchaeota archaeon]|nr:hypothetical protein [Candidatus Parvarchaeota archaeon]MCL5101116.1 hypothetical protein [Candidatus Parvarchaeota archaeon]
MQRSIGSFVFDREVSASELENALGRLDSWVLLSKEKTKIAGQDASVLIYEPNNRSQFIFIAAYNSNGSVRNVNTLIVHSFWSLSDYVTKVKGYLYTLQETLSTEITITSSFFRRDPLTGLWCIHTTPGIKLGQRPVGWQYK